MPKLFTLLLICVTSQLSAQSGYPQYHRLSHRAGVALATGHPDSAWKLFTTAFALVDTPLAKDLRAARSAAIGIRKRNPVAFEEIAFQSHVYDSIADDQERGYDRDYAAFIMKLSAEDQRVRSKKHLRGMREWKTCLTDPQCDRNSESFRKAERLGLEWRHVDSTNIRQLLARIERSGFPSSRRVGNHAAFAANIIMLHFDRDSLNEELGPVIRTAFGNGDLPPEFYAHIIDRRLYYGQHKSPYYYQLPVGNGLDDPNALAEINQRRESIGLGTIAESFRVSTNGSKRTIKMR